MEPFLHITLHQPCIPNNTGTIGRLCVATGCALHLIHPIGFDTSEKACRRAGLDYWPRLRVCEHADWEAYLRDSGATEERLWLFSARRGLPVWEATFSPGDHLVFGGETQGLPQQLLDRYEQRTLRLPLAPGERSINVACAAAAGLFEAMRQLRGVWERRIAAALGKEAGGEASKGYHRGHG
ncbi:MAG: tRNA (cytidine(34)-2'-O)-methyltransferase [Planctomycetota bacterium]|nr:MAG: tRNA (cytidine(34)-2'-O)-methyltransferase [Planctomycetota bacterium]